MRILLDTNFLMIPALFGVDIFSEINEICDFKYELLVLDKTLDELNKVMGEQRGKNKRAAKMALELVKSRNIRIIKTRTEKSVDDILVEMAEKGKTAVATQDKELRVRIKRKGANLIGMRQKKRLFIDKSYNL